MMYYALNLDCRKSKTNGDFEPYLNSGPVVPPTNPQGQVWWQSSDNQATWIPVPGSNANKAGDPKEVSPVVHVGDVVWIAIRDQTATISSVTFAIIFGRRKGHPNQAPIASPFQNTAGGANNTYDQAVFTPLTVITPGDEGFFVYTLPSVAYPSGGTGNVNFGCYVGATVTYTDGTVTTVREFALDPEMAVSDYIASSKRAGAGGETN